MNAQTFAEANSEISRIDDAIDENRAELIRRIGKKPGPRAEAWQAAWSAHPELEAVERELFCERGAMQVVRAQLSVPARSRRQAQTKRRKQCPTCGFHTLHT